jgi:hypothetical protein
MNKNKNKFPGYPGLIILLLTVTAAWCMSWYLLKDLSDRGAFGDMFGAINALFSGLAFAGVIYAIFLQRNELSLQRTELELTRGELKGQKEQMVAQNENIELQNFENTYFNLLKVYNNTVNNLELETGIDESLIIKGKDCFLDFFETYKRQQRIMSCDQPDLTDNERIRRSFSELYRRPQSDIEHYFRIISRIFKFVEAQNIKNKRFYIETLWDQLSNKEVALIFYDSLCKRIETKEIIEKYSLLKNVTNEIFVYEELHRELYSESAYREQT